MDQVHLGTSRYVPANISDRSVFCRYQKNPKNPPKTGNSIIDYEQKNLDRRIVLITAHVSQSDLRESYNDSAPPQDGQPHLSTNLCVSTTL